MRTTRDKFIAYENIRRSGEYNMYVDAATIISIIGVSIDEYLDILRDYEYYANLYINEDGTFKTIKPK